MRLTHRSTRLTKGPLRRGRQGRRSWLMWGLSSLVWTLLTLQSAFASVNLSPVPTFLVDSVDPNVVFILDDSGSMNFEFIGDVEPMGRVSDEDSLELTSTEPEFFSSYWNKLYYDPKQTYLPPLLPDGSGRYPQAKFREAWRDGYAEEGGPDDLRVAYRLRARAVFTDSTCFFTPQGFVCGSFDFLTQRRPHIINESAFYQEFDENSPACETNPGPECFTKKPIVDEPVPSEGLTPRQNFANWYSYYSSRVEAARAGLTDVFIDLDEKIRLAYGAINREAGQDIDGVETKTLVSGVRNATPAHRQAFLEWLHTGEGISGNTPLRRALRDAGEYYRRTDDAGPWSDDPANGTVDGTSAHIECRQSFTILTTDGLWNGDNLNLPNVDNTDGPGHFNHRTGEVEFTYEAVSPFADNEADTLADVAMEYWKNDLRPNLNNKVPTNGIDPAYWQHMRTYTVSFGQDTLVSPEEAFQAIETGANIDWSAGNRIDDLMHAAVNGRGDFFNAQNPEEFSKAIESFLDNILASTNASATAAAVSSSVLRSDSLAFLAGFRADDWSGTLKAIELNSDPTGPAPVKWDGEEKLREMGAGNRNLITFNGAGAVALMDPLDLSSAQRDALNASPSDPANPDGLAAERIGWLRGVPVEENGSLPFRLRVGLENNQEVRRLLGDVVNGNPQFQGKIDMGFGRLPAPEGPKYFEFRQSDTYRDRKDAVYVPANDGFLHAFDSASGEELFGYMPSELLLPETGQSHARISALMRSNYSHRFFVDGTPAISDAFLDLGSGTAQWRTILVGTMGAGGRTVFALDVTEPQSFGTDDVLWEFTHPELGEGVTRPTIARLPTGEWVAIFANGFNSDSEQAGLFVVNLATGQLIRHLSTNSGSSANSNGLSTPIVTSLPENDGISRFAFAGDINGNLWRFDFSDTNTNKWSVERLFQATDPSGNPQPITAQPRVAVNPDPEREGTIVVAFGTGSLFRSGDPNDNQVQTLYGIIDDLANPKQNLERDDLLVQEIETQITDQGREVGRVSDHEFNATNPEEGWLLDLVVSGLAEGERVVNRARFPFGLRANRVQFPTLILDKNPCESGRTGFIMDIKLATGGRTLDPVVDLNNDGEINSDDLVNFGASEEQSANRYQYGVGSELSSVYDPAKELDILVGEEQLNTKGSGTQFGRQTWERLR